MVRHPLRILLVFLLAGNSLFSSAQVNTGQADLRPLLFNEFLNAEIVMKDGSLNRAMVNYNTDNQSMVFKTEKVYMELTGLSEIDFIKIAQDTFVPVEGKIYQKTASGDLLISYTNKPLANEMNATKKGSGVERSKDVSNTMTDVYVSQAYKNLNDLQFIKNYWVRTNNRLLEVSNLKKVSKAFNKEQKETKDFVKSKKLNLSFYPDVCLLMAFLKQ